MIPVRKTSPIPRLPAVFAATLSMLVSTGLVSTGLVSAGLVSTGAMAQSSTADTDAPKARKTMHHGSKTRGEPQSPKASNIIDGQQRSAIAPELPMPKIGTDASSNDYLKAARSSLQSGRTGAAQQALEMAETRELGGSIEQSNGSVPGKSIPGNMLKVDHIHSALKSLGQGDRKQASDHIDQALAS